jgi:hypothetical protein
MKMIGMINYSVEFINDQPALSTAVDRVNDALVIALDIETVNWWDRELERVSLIQLAFRDHGQIRAVIIDAAAGVDLESLRLPLELSLTPKAIHNASFDAVKLFRHYRISTSPIHDTMLAARRSGERRCSLQAQVEAHLGFQLDKAEQRGDWGRRPLSQEQLNYAALDAACTLLLYEAQAARGLRGDYELRARLRQAQGSLPLTPGELRIQTPVSETPVTEPAGTESSSADLGGAALALLGVITELSGRYSPDHLVASAGSERIGLAGWIIDHTVGSDADIDEDTAKQEIAALRERGLARLTPSRKLEATIAGAKFWQDHKPRA